MALEAGLSSLGVPGVPWHTQILAGQLTLFQPGGTDYAHLITTGTPGFSNLPTALKFSATALQYKPQPIFSYFLCSIDLKIALHVGISTTVKSRAVD